MEEEIKLGKKYTVDNLILIEYADEYKDEAIFTILAQEKIEYGYERNFRIDERYVKIFSYDSFEIRSIDLIFFLKGRMDYNDIEPRRICSKNADIFEKALIEFGFTIIHSKDEISQYLVKEEKTEELDLKKIVISSKSTKKGIEEMISKVDIDTFIKIIQCRVSDEVSDKSILGDITREWANSFLQDWAKAKYRFYKLFGNRLTFDIETEYTPTENDGSNILNNLKNKFPLYSYILDKIHPRCVIDNRIYITKIGSSFGDDSRVVDGMSFTKFISLFENDKLNIEVSKIYQSKSKAKLTISIDPCDYLTVSVNKSGWHSCHNFFDGCYKNAGLSYMLDKTTLVSYCGGDKINYTYNLRKFEWNSKSWREMIYISENNSAMVFSRQYPYDDNRYSKAIREALEELIANKYEVPNIWKKVISSDIYTDVESISGLFYNDVKNGYRYIAVINKYDANKEQTTIKIGEKVKTLSSYLAESDNQDWIEDGEEEIW